MRAKLDKTSKREKRGGFWRRLIVFLLIILACIFSIAGVLSAWTKTTTLSTDTFVGTFAPLVKQEAVAKVVSDILVENLFEEHGVDLNDLSNALQLVAPENLPVEDAQTAAMKILQCDRFYEIWEGSLREAHAAAANVVRGKHEVMVTRQGDKVILNLQEFMTRTKGNMVNAGLGFLNKVPVPDDFGQIELCTVSQLGTVESGVHLFEMLAWGLPLLAFTLFAMAILIAKDRRRALLIEGIGLAVTMLVVLVALWVAHNQLLGLIHEQEDLAATDVVWITTLGGFKQATWVLLTLGVVVAVIAGVAGPSRWAVWLREHFSNFFNSLRARREGE